MSKHFIYKEIWKQIETIKINHFKNFQGLRMKELERIHFKAVEEGPAGQAIFDIFHSN